MSYVAIAILGLAVVTFYLSRICAKLDNLATLLNLLLDAQAQSASSLRAIDHNTDVIRERTPDRG